MLKDILRILPDELCPLSELTAHDDMEEIRLRVGCHLAVVKRGRDFLVPSVTVTAEHVNHVLAAASGSSLYAVNDTLRDGYITIPGGHRIGICGQAATENSIVKTFRNISSVSIRIAKERKGIGTCLHASTIILGPPGCGKTTLLRDCVRMLSDETQSRVSIVDERCEIAACNGGLPQFYVGQRTDVLCGCPKSEGIHMVLRSMNPEWIAVDEITEEKDVEAICKASYCGVKLLATAHALNLEDLQNRPVYRSVLRCRVFTEALILKKDHTYMRQRLVNT